jgi:hypothetical protein
MAQTDLTGLLTGISSAPIDPRDSMTAQQEMLSRSSEANRGLRRGIGALTGANTQTTKEKAEAALAQLDPSNKADREQILRIVSQINPARVPVLRQAFADKDKADAAASVTSGQAQERLDIQRIQAGASQTSAAASKLAAEGGGKLSVSSEKAIRDAETAAAKSEGQKDLALGMAARYSRLKPTGGAGGKAIENFKTFMGGQDEVSSLKTQFEGLVATGIIGALPPGVASDKDIEMAKSGFPNSGWSAEEIESWLLGRAKLQAFQSERSRFEAQWISENKGDASGWNNAWDELKKTEGFAQSIVDKYNLPALDLPKEDLSFDEATFAAIQEKKRQAAQNQAQGRIAGATGGFGL